jgi:hypothetical protein
MTANPIIIRDDDWPKWVAARTEAHYEKLALPGAYWDIVRLRTYTSETTFKEAFVDGQRWARMLMKHEELGHGRKVPKHEHPTDPWPMFQHAVACWFDDRAGTRLLRFFWYKPTMADFVAWEKQVKRDWMDRKVRVYSKDEAERAGL